MAEEPIRMQSISHTVSPGQVTFVISDANGMSTSFAVTPAALPILLARIATAETDAMELDTSEVTSDLVRSFNIESFQLGAVEGGALVLILSLPGGTRIPIGMTPEQAGLLSGSLENAARYRRPQ